MIPSSLWDILEPEVTSSVCSIVCYECYHLWVGVLMCKRLGSTYLTQLKAVLAWLGSFRKYRKCCGPRSEFICLETQPDEDNTDSNPTVSSLWPRSLGQRVFLEWVGTQRREPDPVVGSASCVCQGSVLGFVFMLNPSEILSSLMVFKCWKFWTFHLGPDPSEF